jgi:leucyl aminopeptidase
MQFHMESSPLSEIETDLLVVGVLQDKPVKEQIAKLDAKFPKDFLSLIEQNCADESFTGKPNQSLQLPTYGKLPYKKLVIWGLGPATKYNTACARKLAANIARQTSSKNSLHSVTFLLPEASADISYVQALSEGFQLGAFSFKKYKTGKDDKPKSKIAKVTIAAGTHAKKEFDKSAALGAAIGEATNFARTLIAEPAAYLTPTRLAEEAKQLESDKAISVTIFDPKEIEKLKMGSFLGVAKGAKEPCKLIVIKYNAPKAKKTVGLIGKGITFDSGGLSLKPAQSMETMKYDMAGAAAVLATMKAVSVLKPAVSIVAVIAATENMPGGQAMHPGDVLTAMNGKTIEVNNTDAEGRLILADALCYALKEGADELIDIATLTGACVTALGRAAAGIMGNDDQLVNKVIAAGDQAGEKYWRLPLYDEYKEYLKSDIADLKNAGARGEAGSSAAGMFLAEFVDGKPWAHLDIAGPGWLDKDRDENNKGGTGFGVRTLCQFLLNQSAK